MTENKKKQPQPSLPGQVAVSIPSGLRLADLEAMLRLEVGLGGYGRIYLSFSGQLPAYNRYDAMFSYDLGKDGTLPAGLAGKSVLHAAAIYAGPCQADYFLCACDGPVKSPFDSQALGQAVKSCVEELEAYKALGALAQVQDACGKQEEAPVLIRKKRRDIGTPLRQGDFVYYGCPRCDAFFTNGWYYPPLRLAADMAYCKRCGQKLGWERPEYDPEKPQEWAYES